MQFRSKMQSNTQPNQRTESTNNKMKRQQLVCTEKPTTSASLTRGRTRTLWEANRSDTEATLRTIGIVSHFVALRTGSFLMGGAPDAPPRHSKFPTKWVQQHSNLLS